MPNRIGVVAEPMFNLYGYLDSLYREDQIFPKMLAMHEQLLRSVAFDL
mgnify:CR=1 FL=1